MTSQRSRPNLVLVFSDQQSRDMVGAYGASSARTPRLDALARDSVLFDHCYSSAPACTPHRSMLVTGQHPLWNNCFQNDRQLLTGNGTTFAQALTDAGYSCGYVGKWHLYGGDRDRPVPEGPHRHGFDASFLTNNCHLNYDPEHAFYWDDDGRERRFGTWEVEGQTGQALDFIDAHADDPFALFVSYHAPHNHDGGDPETYASFDAPPEFKAAYDPDEIELRPTIPDNERSRRMVHGYLAMCTEVDHHVGRIVDRLAERGLLDDTIVVYTSDHGETFGAYWAHWHKSTPEDVSVRVPLIVRLPGAEQGGRRSDLLVGTLDLMPTLLSLMGVPVPAECQGTDLAPAIHDEDDDAAESVPLFYFTAPWRGVVTRRWTYAFEHVDRRPEALREIASDLGRSTLLRGFDVLYDREQDPHQLLNLFGQRDVAGLHGTEQAQKELHEMTVAWLDRFSDPFPTQTALHAAAPDGAGRPVDLLREIPAWRG